jgi:hypothetical protein
MTTDNTQYLDMSVVHDKVVADALPQLLTEWRMKKRWVTLDGKTLSLHHTILNAYLKTGAPPDTEELNGEQLDDLCDRDLIVMDGNVISAAYPFSTVTTLHKVEIDNVSIANVCAIDALGSGAMAHKAACVTCQCATCKKDIVVRLSDNGLNVENTSPAAPRVWAGIVPISGCAANTQCQSMLMFCNQQHLDDWMRTKKQKPDGYDLNVEQAVELGAAIFRPFFKA